MGASRSKASAKPRGRKRGGSLRISREQILAAARSLDPQNLTMQAVADKLDVDRKALNYHVTDRDGLLRLITASVFEETFSAAFKDYLEAGSAPDIDWKAATRTWAITVRDSLVKTGIPSDYVPLGADDIGVLQPAEFILQRMLAAGFDILTASRGLTFVTALAMGVGREVLLLRPTGEPAQVAEVKALLARHGNTNGFDAFRRLASLAINERSDIDAQFEFQLDVFIDGMQQRLGATE